MTCKVIYIGNGLKTSRDYAEFAEPAVALAAKTPTYEADSA
jgi:hypothetical protein